MIKQIILLTLFLSTYLFGQITFDSDFEGGNLSSVEEIDSLSFYVTPVADPGINGGSTRWIYFRMSGVVDKEVQVFFIKNDVTKAMYSYDNETFIRFTDEEAPSSGLFYKRFEEDTVYVAFYTPYNYSFLQKRIKEWNQSSFVHVDTLGLTPQGFPIQEITVTDKSVPDSLKRSIWIHARTHTSETPSSWQFDGIMEELLSDNEAVKHYLKELVFHMIPFTNPDGVFFGRSRVNYEGINLETNWDKTEESTSGEVKILKARMKQLNDEKPFSVFLNLHSQASSYCTFWIHNASSTSEEFYRREYQFSNLNTSDNPYFTQWDYSESSLKPIYPEGWLWDNYGEQVMALTYETPYNSYFKSSSEPNIEVTNQNLGEIGRRTVYAIAEYLQVSHPHHQIVDNINATISGSSVNYSVGTQFYGDDFVALESNTSSAVFNTEELPSGSYDIAAWWPTSEGNSYETVFEITAGSNYYEDTKTQKINGGQWNYLTSVELNSEGRISIRMNNNATGLVVADAFRLIYNGPVTDVEDQNIPTEFNLYQNYPNPFNPVTTIKYSIPNLTSDIGASKNVSLVVFDLLGRKVLTLVDVNQPAGEYEVQFSGLNLASGTYFYRLQVGNFAETKKMVLMK